jgi:hypothetical protein
MDIAKNAGMDIAKDDFKVCFPVMTPELDAVGQHDICRTPKRFEAFSRWINRKRIADLDLHFTV